ncbi:aldehyde dehydrogenase (NADP(+)) [Chitinophaga sp. MD30]|uniref:aldehyde dehydrogenase (NADP(+)) n=1 Tax=Chitinophaga sp. MD30 TaxID=2033437 RepID=UPI000BAE6DD8|nr:aldehyde dehydrogenase (NADP(+)) [Chitinophaga sp. MD30]ASZ14241.1 aldehyde dehydrogenase (NADP(+)) [Chitinophaga sp. MD30]
MNITGRNSIGYSWTATGDTVLSAYNPVSREILPERFIAATEAEMETALTRATAAFTIYRHISGADKATFLEAIAAEILALGDVLLHRAVAESGLPLARITGERGRTMQQLQLFATLLREGSWVEAVIDTAIPDRQPLPRPDLRTMWQPLGPVLVFPASNFPLAFSTAGGDTAAALAAGNPVIVKAHESHPGTNELVAGAISRAAATCGMPDGVFSSLNGYGHTLGQALVRHPAIKAIGFTGSQRAGKAIMATAAARPIPIPVYAEMGSKNPVLLLPGKVATSAAALAQQYAASITQGAGQFCTNPGLLIAMAGPDTDHFAELLALALQQVQPAPMLNKGVYEQYYAGLKSLQQQDGVRTLQAGVPAADALAYPALLQVDSEVFTTHAHLQEEVFGPSSLLVTCKDMVALQQTIIQLQGQLTATVLGDRYDLQQYAVEIQLLQDKAGRILFNGVPTGVEVCEAMVHGGPFPASSDARSTSVGTAAIRRFVRPVCLQDCPPALLPDALKEDNPLHIWRKVNGQWTR